MAKGKSLTALGALFLMLGGIACNKKSSNDIAITISAEKGEPLIEVGKSIITVEAARQDFQERQGQFKGAPNLNTPKSREDYIESQVIQEALFLEAVEQKYFDRSDVKRDVKKILVQKLMRDKLENAQNDFVPTDAQINEHYQKNQNLYNRDEALKVAYVNIPFGSKKEQSFEAAKAMHKDALETVKNANAKEFSRIAARHVSKLSGNAISIETNQTDYLEKTAFDQKFGNNAFDAIKNLPEIGQISPLLTTPNSYMVVMKVGYRKPIKETVEDAKQKIIKRLAYENRGEVYKKYIESLKQKYPVTVHKEKIAELSTGVPSKVATAEVPDKLPGLKPKVPDAKEEPKPAE